MHKTKRKRDRDKSLHLFLEHNDACVAIQEMCVYIRDTKKNEKIKIIIKGSKNKNRKIAPFLKPVLLYISLYTYIFFLNHSMLCDAVIVILSFYFFIFTIRIYNSSCVLFCFIHIYIHFCMYVCVICIYLVTYIRFCLYALITHICIYFFCLHNYKEF